MHRGTIRISLSALVCAALFFAACSGDGGGGGSGSGITPASGGFGGRLQSGANFSIILMIVEDESEVVDFVGVACAPGGTLGSGAVTVEEGVPIDDSAFSAESGDVMIEGEFSSATEAAGTAEAKTPDAEGCIGTGSVEWTSECDLTVERAAQEEQEGDLFIGGSSTTVDGGTAFGFLEIVAADDQRITAELIESGGCETS